MTLRQFIQREIAPLSPQLQKQWIMSAYCHGLMSAGVVARLIDKMGLRDK